MWWSYFPLFVALATPVSTAAREQLALLAPDHLLYHAAYRRDLSMIVVASCAAWYLVAKVASSRREPLNRGIVAGGIAIVALTLAMLNFPFRLLYQNKFDATLWNDTTCYVIGERGDARLMFCPDLPQPRIRVASDKSSLRPTDVTESIFVRFSQQDPK
jgi:hypothetical protein